MRVGMIRLGSGFKFLLQGEDGDDDGHDRDHDHHLHQLPSHYSFCGDQFLSCASMG